MAWQVTVSSGLKEVVLPDGLRYQGGAVVVLNDAQYGSLSANAVATLFSSVSQLGGGGSGLSVRETAGIDGFALTDGTPTILTWTAPDDGSLHRFELAFNGVVTSNLTGGAINATFFAPDGLTESFFGIWNANNPTGAHQFANGASGVITIAPGTTVTVYQSSAVTAGAATVWPEIWGS
jgi:hypothetical protein